MAEIVTFGCRLNTVESEAIRTMAGHLAETVIVNTCAVTTEAERQARQAIARLRRERPGATIIATGCAVQIDPARWAAIPGVARIVGNQEKLQPGTWHGRANAVAPIASARGHVPAALPGIEGRARAFLDVQQGCDHACTFCIIPQGRGTSRSVPAEAVAAHVRRLAAEGHHEVVLTGVDLASWGRDLPDRPGVAQLLRDVLTHAPQLARLRLSSLDPAMLDDAFWDVFAAEQRLMPHLHLSVQAGSDMVLKRMRRRHGRGDVLSVIGRARHVRPGTAVGADLIAGFPTETEAQAEDSVRLLQEACIPYVHVFPYSARPGTPAARMPQLPVAVRRGRAARLRAAARPYAAAAHRALIGQDVAVVAERGGRGHTPGFAPVQFNDEPPVGALVMARIVAGDADRIEAGSWR